MESEENKHNEHTDHSEEGEEGEEVSTAEPEKVRELLGVTDEEFEDYCKCAWEKVIWRVKDKTPPLEWEIRNIEELSTQIQGKIEQGRGKLDVPHQWFLLVALISACRTLYNYTIKAPLLVKDQTPSVMWDLMKIDVANTLSKKAVKKAAKTVYKSYGHGDFPNVNKLKEKNEMVKMLKTSLNYPLDLDDRFYAWILFYTANLQRKAIVK
ncbi:hypothetical protein FPQ18DRAFT_326975, partial [Pyronema domesticum]